MILESSAEESPIYRRSGKRAETKCGRPESPWYENTRKVSGWPPYDKCDRIWDFFFFFSRGPTTH